MIAAAATNQVALNPMTLAVIVLMAIVLLVILGVVFQVLGLYVRAWVSNAPVSLLDLIGIRLRKIDARRVINSYIIARREKLAVQLNELQSHLLIGGDVEHCVSAMVVAQRAGTPLSWRDVTTLDLAGPDAVAYAKQSAPRTRPGMSLVASAPMRRETMAAMR